MSECREHHFGSDGRCKVCSMRLTYYQDARDILNKWTERQIKEDKAYYESVVASYKCNPHIHDPHHGIITPEEHLALHDPFYKLIDLEAEQ